MDLMGLFSHVHMLTLHLSGNIPFVICFQSIVQPFYVSSPCYAVWIRRLVFSGFRPVLKTLNVNSLVYPTSCLIFSAKATIEIFRPVQILIWVLRTSSIMQWHSRWSVCCAQPRYSIWCGHCGKTGECHPVIFIPGKMRISEKVSPAKKRRRTALPKEPVPPVMRRVLLCIIFPLQIW